jgi:cyanophycin synthetase
MSEGSPPGMVELRVLDGPNLYFTRPAIKLTLDVAAWNEAPEERVLDAAARAGLRGAARAALPGPRAAGGGRTSASARPGQPGTDHRRRFVARVGAQLTRRLAAATGTHLAVRARTGPEPDQLVVAFPWRRRTAAEAFGREVAGVLSAVLAPRRSVDRLLREAARRLEHVPDGPGPSVPVPRVPVIAVTGTNGKTTTVRLLAHLLRTAGLSVAYSSTDGVYLDGELVEEGDYSGFAGAGKALSQPGVQAAVLETARGGILLRGIGTTRNDVAVVTNVSADHLGMHGITTIDQLAEVKSTILRTTRTDGWGVLNADDPRVLAMRRVARGRPFLVSLDPDHPALRSVMGERGRAMTVIDGSMAVLTPGRDPHPLVALEDVPVTLAGISGMNVQNAMCAAAAALGAGIPERDVVKGLRSFVLDPKTNPGRANLFELDDRVIVVDYAHNEAGMQGLIEICRGLARRGATVWIAYSTAGDRSDEIMHGIGYLAARGADRVAVFPLMTYLRGRKPAEIVRLLRAGAEDGGATDVPDFPDEMHVLDWMLSSSEPGDVLGITALSQRREIFALMEERGAARVGAARVRRLVRRARGRAGGAGGARTRP